MNELVLIVEDEENIAEMMRYSLDRNGYRTVVTADGEKALRAVQYDRPDLVLLDIMLPRMDGWNVCRILRESERDGSLPVIIVTALCLEEARIQGLQLGADDYLSKPFLVQELLLRVRRILDRRQAVKELRDRSTERDVSIRNIVHALKNGLATITGFAELAAMKQGASSELTQIVRTAEELGRQLDGVFRLCRTEHGHRRIKEEPCRP